MRADRLALVVGLAAFAAVGRLLLVAVPGVSLSYLVLFVAGVAFGVRVGGAVGALARLASDVAISGFNPVFLPMVAVDAAFGACAGFLGRVANFGQHGPARGLLPRAILLNLALVATLAYSVLADTLTWLFYTWVAPGADNVARNAFWWALVVQGLAFNVPAAVFNAALFPATVPRILDALRNAGLLPDRPTPDPTRGANSGYAGG